MIRLFWGAVRAICIVSIPFCVLIAVASTLNRDVATAVQSATTAILAYCTWRNEDMIRRMEAGR